MVRLHEDTTPDLGLVNEAKSAELDVSYIRSRVMDNNVGKKSPFDIGALLGADIIVAARLSDHFCSPAAQQDIIRGLLSSLGIRSNI